MDEGGVLYKGDRKDTDEEVQMKRYRFRKE